MKGLGFCNSFNVDMLAQFSLSSPTLYSGVIVHSPLPSGVFCLVVLVCLFFCFFLVVGGVSRS